jgi:hypothetical protein
MEARMPGTNNINGATDIGSLMSLSANELQHYEICGDSCTALPSGVVITKLQHSESNGTIGFEERPL